MEIHPSSRKECTEFPSYQAYMETKNPCIAMVPSPGFSLLVPLVEFSKRLVVHLPHFHITFFIPTLGPPSPITLSIFQSLPPQIDFIMLPQINMDDLKANNPATQMQRAMTLSLSSLLHHLSSTSFRTRLVAMVADLFSVDALDIAWQLNLKSYVFHSSSVTSLSFFLHFPKLDEDLKKVSSEFRELSEPLKLPGCVSFHGKDLPDAVQERSSDIYKTFLHMGKRFHSADGIIVNSFLDLEQEVATALQESDQNYPSLYPVGPILQTSSTNTNRSSSDCLTWLDNQPQNSVLYVSFGSGGTLSHDQLHELALGLETSGHKFLWVVRAPSGSASSAYLSAQKQNPLEFLPEGFIDRTKDQGFVISSWAPQIEVLRHESTGGFLTHCGWNSTLEGMVHGKPIIAWPLFAEQRMNAVMLTEQFKVAVRPKGDHENRNGIINREEVARVVRLVMEGDEGREIRGRIQVFRDAAAEALSEDGSSTRTMSNLALELKNLSGM